MLGSVADRLIRTLSVQHVAFFLREDSESGGFRLKMVAGNRGGRPAVGQVHDLPSLNSAPGSGWAGRGPAPPESLDLSFLPAVPDKPYLFFERTRHLLDVVSREMPPSARRAVADLDLTYYLPCTTRGRTIAWLGVSRTEKGDFLSSDDIELLLTLSGYVGIAIENARLYRSLQRKVDEYERLKEFSENIVESINVGILAADLDDRVESWNTQMEQLTGVTRESALGRRLPELFPAELCVQFDRVRGETGIHHIYNFGLVGGRPTERAQRPWRGRQFAPPSAQHRHRAAGFQGREQIGRLMIFDDITERAELERRLVQADKLSSIGLLAAGVAHEVNTPLAVISTYAQMLAKQVSGDEQKSRCWTRSPSRLSAPAKSSIRC